MKRWAKSFSFVTLCTIRNVSTEPRECIEVHKSHKNFGDFYPKTKRFLFVCKELPFEMIVFLPYPASSFVFFCHLLNSINFWYWIEKGCYVTELGAEGRKNELEAKN